MRIWKKFASPLFAMFCFCVILSLNCNNDTPIANRPDLIDPDDLGKRLQSTTAVAIDTSAAEAINTYGGSYLALGKFDNFESQMLIRFPKLTLADTVSFVAGTLKMPEHLTAGKGAAFEATVHVVTTPWDSSKVIKLSDVMSNPMPFARQQIVPPAKDTTDVDTVSFKLDSTVVKSWRDSQAAANGILIKAANATFLKTFHSSFSVAKRPVLELVTRRRSGTKNDTTRLGLGPTVFLFQRFAPLRSGPVYVGNGEKHTAILYFNLDFLPKSATINRATLTLEVDAANSALAADGVTLRLFPLDTSYTAYRLNIDTVSVRSEKLTISQLLQLSVANANTKTPSFNLPMTSIVQAWILNPSQNLGVALLPAVPRNDFFRAALFSRETNPARAPKLEIVYTTPPQ